MQFNLKKKILFDANAIIDLHKYSPWKRVIHACHATVTPIIKREARFYKDEQGQKRQIDLSSDIEARKIEEVPVSIEISYRKQVNILNIDLFTIGNSRELSRCQKPIFECVSV